MKRRIVVAAALGTYTLVFHLVSIALRDLRMAAVAWSDFNWTIIALIAGLKCLDTARRHDIARYGRAWRAIAVGCLSWFFGMLIWSWRELALEQVVPFPSIGELFFIGAAIPIVLGISAYRPNATNDNLTLKQLGDLGVVVSTMLMVCSIVLYRPAMLTNESPFYISVALAYPIVHMSGLAFGALCLWQGARGSERVVVALLLGGLTCLTGVTAMYAMTLLETTYVTGQLSLDVYWVATFALIVWASYEEDWREQIERDDETLRPIRELDPLVTVGAISTVGVAMVLLRENWTEDLIPIISAGFFLMAVSLGVRHRGTLLVERDLSGRLQQLNVELEDRVRARTVELADARDAAELANRTKSRFLANMSHELRTPLTAIIGYSEMLAEEAEDPNLREDLNQIEVAGKQLLQLINEVLDLSKVEAGRLELHYTDVDVPRMIEDVRATMAPVVGRFGNTLTISVDPGFERMWTDATRVRQVLFNLLSNAAKFTREGQIALRVTRSGSWAMLVVEDSGIGMAPEDLARVFEPFEQVEGVSNSDSGGTGLGLPISRRFCELLGGELTATSAPGVGSAFTVRLPLRHPDDTAPGSDRVLAAAS